jgi:AcrR family transcriptional regulator
MDAVAKEAHVAINTVYKHFSSKDKLVEAYLIRRDQRWLHWFTSFVNRVGNPKERLLAVFDALDEWFRSDEFRGCAFINAAGEMGTEKAFLTKIVNDHKQSLYMFIKSIAVEAKIGDADTVTQHLMLLVEGAIINAQLDINQDAACSARKVAAMILPD